MLTKDTSFHWSLNASSTLLPSFSRSSSRHVLTNFLNTNLRFNPTKYYLVKYKRFRKIVWIGSHHFHLHWKFKLLAGKFSKVCWQCPAKFCLYTSTLKQTFRPIIWIFTEGDEIECRLPFKIFSTLLMYSLFKLLWKKWTFHKF